jgi:segregation and condensation protein B
MSLKNQVEALLFSSGKAMEEEKLAELVGAEKRTVRAALKALEKEYASRDTSLRLFNEGSVWKMHVRDEHIPLVRRIVADTELSKATLETLAVIAYSHPNALQSKVVDMRGSSAYEHIKELLELGFVTKAKEGRSFTLRLTEKFFEYFDVEGGKGIRQAFGKVKMPVPKEQQKQLGELQVVALPETATDSKNAPKLGGLEIIDENPVSENRKGTRQARSEQQEPEETAPADEPEEAYTAARLERDPEQEQSFLSKIEEQIEQLTKKNDEREQDPLFRPALAETASPQAPGQALEPSIPPASRQEEGEAEEKLAQEREEEEKQEEPEQKPTAKRPILRKRK